MFLPLTRDEIKQISRLVLKGVKKNLQRQELSIELNEDAYELIAELGYDPQFGARPLKRVIQKELVNELSKRVLGGYFNPGDIIHVGVEGRKIIFDEKPITDKGVEADPEADEKKKTRRSRKRKKDVENLEQATKDVEDAAQQLKTQEGAEGG